MPGPVANDAMRVLNLLQAGADYVHKRPGGSRVEFPNGIDYQAIAEDGEHIASPAAA